MTTNNQIDVVAFAAHPDDIELSCGGTMRLFAAKGYTTAIIDLTRGELSSRGDLESRARETEAASAVLRVSQRENLGMPDGMLGLGPEVEAQTLQIVEVLRRLRPKLVLIPPGAERHPDHVAAHTLLRRALFFAGVHRYPHDGQLQPNRVENAHTVSHVMLYEMRYEMPFHFIVDISEFYEDKYNAIACYATQVSAALGGTAKTLLSLDGSLTALQARDKHYGALIGTQAGEAFATLSALGVSDPLSLLEAQPSSTPFLFRQ